MSSSEKILERVQRTVESIDTKLASFPALQSVHEKTGVSRVYFAGGASFVLLMIIFFGFGAGFLWYTQ